MIQIVFKKIPYMSEIYKSFEEVTNEKSIGKWIVLSGTIIQSTQVNFILFLRKELCKKVKYSSAINVANSTE
jgi:hypothetical protein